MLRRLVEDGKPDYFAVVFDAPGKTFRDDWYPQYKANRAADAGRSRACRSSRCTQLVRAHGWPLLMVEGVEADDVIGTLAAPGRGSRHRHDHLVVGQGPDAARAPRIRMVNTMSNETFDEAGVLAKFDVRPDQVLDLLTLTGDAVDNVPGRRQGRAQDRGQVARAIRHARQRHRACAARSAASSGNNLREALEWLPQGRRLLTVQDRLRRCR